MPAFSGKARQGKVLSFFKKLLLLSSFFYYYKRDRVMGHAHITTTSTQPTRATPETHTHASRKCRHTQAWRVKTHTSMEQRLQKHMGCRELIA